VEPLERAQERKGAPSLGQRTAMRIVKDEGDEVVLVYESEPSKANPAPTALVFESRKESLRLLQYPAEWRRLTPEQLLALRPNH
jgi:hypothetical protein